MAGQIAVDTGSNLWSSSSVGPTHPPSLLSFYSPAVKHLSRHLSPCLSPSVRLSICLEASVSDFKYLSVVPYVHFCLCDCLSDCYLSVSLTAGLFCLSVALPTSLCLSVFLYSWFTLFLRSSARMCITVWFSGKKSHIPYEYWGDAPNRLNPPRRVSVSAKIDVFTSVKMSQNVLIFQRSHR